jgi:hypothetical protein
VPAGSDVLGSHLDQGFVTQRVTNYLNLAGAAALAMLGWDFAASSDAVRWRRRLRWALWGVLAVTLIALVVLHLRLDALLDADEHVILDRSAFRTEHRLYLNISTVQWVAGLAALLLCVAAWQGKQENT